MPGPGHVLGGGYPSKPLWIHPPALGEATPGPFAVVQDWVFADSGAAVAASTTVNLGVPAIVGNGLLAAVNCDATVTTPAGWSLVVSSIHNAACYLFAKIAVGGETGITVTPALSASTCVGIVELAGLVGVSVAAITDQIVANGSSTGATTRSTGTTPPTTQPDEYAVAVWGYSGSQAVYPSGGANKWGSQTNAFVEKGDVGTTRVTGTNVGLCVAVRLLSATGAVESTASTAPDSPPSESLMGTFRVGSTIGDIPTRNVTALVAAHRAGSW